MGSVAYVENEKKDLEEELHRLARLGLYLLGMNDGVLVVKNGLGSSLVAEVKKNSIKIPYLER